MLKYIIRFLELVLLITISVYLVYFAYISEDWATLQGYLNINFVGLVWLFPISAPLAVCVLISLINSISLKGLYRKVVFGIHVFNILFIPFVSQILPKPKEPTAQLMADNYNQHRKEFQQLKEAVRDLVMDDMGIDYEVKGGKVETFGIQCENGEWVKIKDAADLKKKNPLTKITPIQLRNIERYMKAANVQGITAYNYEQEVSLLFARWGLRKFEYVLYFSRDAAEQDKSAYGGSRSYIMLNDSITFVTDGIYPGGGEFCDYEQFTKSIEKSDKLKRFR